MSVTALLEAHPSLGGHLDFLPLGSFPTRVEPLALATELGLGDVWIKREDLSGEVYGGNKVRKLQGVLGNVVARGLSRLLTVGTFGSHHVLATALYGRQVGLEVDALLLPQPPTGHALSTLAATARLCRRVTWSPSPLLSPVVALLALARATGWPPRRFAIVGPGGSSAHGLVGDVGAAFELSAQVRAGDLPEPAWVLLPFGTGGTASGLALGLAWAGLKTRVWAVRAVHPRFANLRAARRHMVNVIRLLRDAGADPPSPEAALTRLVLDGEQYAPGYGWPSAAGVEASQRLQSSGLVLDPGYGAKAAAALLAHGRDLEGPVLWWLTGNGRDLTALPAASPPSARLPQALQSLLATSTLQVGPRRDR